MPKIKFSDLKRINSPQMPAIKKAIAEIVDSGWYILGNKVKEFEKVFASFAGTSFCVGTGSGLEAISLALEALELPPNSEVLVPVNSCIATALAVSRSNLIPVLVDVHPETFNIDVSDAKRKISAKTRCIIAVHLYGQCCDMDAVLALCKEYKLFLIEDAAQAHGAKFKGKPAGGFGNAAAFSFYPTKNLGALGDGGAVVTNDEKIFKRVNLLRNYGSDCRYIHDIKGSNSRLDEIQAAVLLVKLQDFDRQQQERELIAEYYNREIKNPYIVLPKKPKDGVHAWHLYVIKTRFRKELQVFLNSKGIETLIHYPIPIHKQEAYFEYRSLNFLVAEVLQDEILSIPLYPGLSSEEIKFVADSLNQFQPKKI